MCVHCSPIEFFSFVHLFVCGSQCAKKTESVFVIHNIPLTYLNCLLILLMLGEQVVSARVHTLHTVMCVRISCELCVRCNGPVRREKGKNEKQFWVLPRRGIEHAENHLRLHCIRWLPIYSNTHTSTHKRDCIQFYYALYNSQQRQYRQQQMYNVYAIKWIEKPLAQGVAPSMQYGMACWFLSLSFYI